MKIISMVPSWTETLIECGVNVVGKTRFCIHLGQNQKNQDLHRIPAVGGTKDWSLEKVQSLDADFVILDREENPIWMKEQSPFACLVTHVTSILDMERELLRLAAGIPTGAPGLNSMADRWGKVLARKRTWDWNRIPGEIQVIRRDFDRYETLVYVIWKNPWMQVSKETFIGSVLCHLGAKSLLAELPQKYPEFRLADFDLRKTYFLFSSEPFPFHKKKQELSKLGVQGSLVDGEAFSWFGIRSLRFLESL